MLLCTGCGWQVTCFLLNHNGHICEKEGNVCIFIVDMNIRVLGKVPHLTALYHSNVIAVLGFGIPVCWHRSTINFGSVIPVISIHPSADLSTLLSLQPLFPLPFLPSVFHHQRLPGLSEHLSSASPPYSEPSSPLPSPPPHKRQS